MLLVFPRPLANVTCRKHREPRQCCAHAERAGQQAPVAIHASRKPSSGSRKPGCPAHEGRSAKMQEKPPRMMKASWGISQGVAVRDVLQMWLGERRDRTTRCLVDAARRKHAWLGDAACKPHCKTRCLANAARRQHRKIKCLSDAACWKHRKTPRSAHVGCSSHSV